MHFEQDTGEVIVARCTCVAGNGVCCKHVAAALFQMQDFIELELTEVPDDLTCTQILQEWHVPSCENIKTAILFDSVKFSKAASTKSSSLHLKLVTQLWHLLNLSQTVIFKD